MTGNRSDDPAHIPASAVSEIAVPASAMTAPALKPPRWSGKKTAVVAALAITLTSGGAVAAATAVPEGTGANVGRGGMGGPGGPGGMPERQNGTRQMPGPDGAQQAPGAPGPQQMPGGAQQGPGAPSSSTGTTGGAATTGTTSTTETTTTGTTDTPRSL